MRSQLGRKSSAAPKAGSGEASFEGRNGTLWHLVFDVAAFESAARALKVDAADLPKRIFARPDPATEGALLDADLFDVAELLRAGLARRHGPMALPAAVNLLGLGRPVMDAILQAMARFAMPELKSPRRTH